MSPDECRGQEGMSLVEVLVALVIAIVAVLATGSLLATGTKSSVAGQRDVQLLSVAQRELEAVTTIARRSGFDAVALGTAPAAATGATVGANPANPNSFVGGGALSIQSDYNSAAAALRTEPLIVGGTGAYPAAGMVAPFTAGVTSGNLRANVYRFVSDDTTAGCPAGATCTGDVRRVTVAVVAASPGELQRTKPVWLSTTLGSPQPTGSNTGGGGSLALSLGLTP